MDPPREPDVNDATLGTPPAQRTAVRVREPWRLGVCGRGAPCGAVPVGRASTSLGDPELLSCNSLLMSTPGPDRAVGCAERASDAGPAAVRVARGPATAAGRSGRAHLHARSRRRVPAGGGGAGAGGPAGGRGPGAARLRSGSFPPPRAGSFVILYGYLFHNMP